ncbi:MAG: hypothetical protein M1821_002758 [Bathelium mastoideum]|nr:MAG: hypothetical protein M1821_002758 [Bathelium mastoideum]KAI9683781.1 MAG: hypothetical protein M1822_005971 [Bathelium mastoideum]
MAPPPAVVIIVRHGARLDAADKSWHLSSPTPYDPPLTYGGWTQSKALGARIASLVQRRQQIGDQNRSRQKAPEQVQVTDFGSPQESPGKNGSSQERGSCKRKKHKVFIHSSPFQRCVQTSIAISAGMAQATPTHEAKSDISTSATATNGAPHFRAKSQFSKSPEKSHSPTLAPIKQGEIEDYDSNSRTQLEQPRRPDLRIDAFLGEWLSPDYYEAITPPPKSTLMIAGAKADLLRRGENIEEFQAVGSHQGNFPGGWSSGASKTPASAPPPPSPGQESLMNISSIDHALPQRERSSSHGVTHVRPKSPLATYSPTTSGSYIPPQPAYAISPAEPIPRGYVAHAREACIDIDYQWDSMREPQEWGDGGEFGEEWSAMHKRFRNGLSKMIQWYRDHGIKNPVVEDHEAVSSAQEEDNTDDEEVEVVLILVTHGAGCNALIGALTDQPALLDVGMASLTMAVRKETAGDCPRFSPTDAEADKAAGFGRRGSIARELSQEYDMRLVASAEHLRAGIDPTKIPSVAVFQGSPRFPVDQRRRQGTWSSTNDPFVHGDSSRGVNSALGSIRRTSVTAAAPPLNRATTLQNPPSIQIPSGNPGGLWSKRPSTAGEEISRRSPERDLGLNFSDSPNKNTARGLDGTDEQEDEEELSTVPPMPVNLGRSFTQQGLWGSRPSGSVTERDKGPKRRWTLMQGEA